LPTFEQGLGRIGFGISPSNPNVIYATVDANQQFGGIYRSDDAGESWRKVSGDPRTWGRGSDFAEVKVHPENPDIVFGASYPPDSAGMYLARQGSGPEPKHFGRGVGRLGRWGHRQIAARERSERWPSPALSFERTLRTKNGTIRKFEFKCEFYRLSDSHVETVATSDWKAALEGRFAARVSTEQMKREVCHKLGRDLSLRHNYLAADTMVAALLDRI